MSQKSQRILACFSKSTALVLKRTTGRTVTENLENIGEEILVC